MSNNLCGIYSITNIETTPEKIYFGQSKNIEKRLKRHKNDLNKQKHCNNYLQRAWNKYGKEAFIFSPFRLVENGKDLTYLEAQVINEAKELGMEVYNIKDPEDPAYWTTEARKKISDFMKGNTYSSGLVHSKEAIEKRIIFLTGKKCSKETRSKISNSLMGRPLSENHKKKISEAKKGTFTGNSNPNYGNRHTAEAIKKMSEVRKQYWSNKNKGSSNG